MLTHSNTQTHLTPEESACFPFWFCVEKQCFSFPNVSKGKKERKSAGQERGMPPATRRSNAHTHVYASERTYAYDKGLHRPRVTLETSTNKHTCQTGWNIQTLSHTHTVSHTKRKKRTDTHTHTHTQLTLTLLKKVLWQPQLDSSIHK